MIQRSAHHHPRNILAKSMCTEKKMHSLKVENYVYSASIFRERASQIKLEKEMLNPAYMPGYIGIFAITTRSENKRLLLIKEKQISPVKEFSTFLGMGRCKSGLTEITPQLSGARILCFLILSFLKLHHQGWLQSDGY